ncbi:hypothetical protein N0V84_008510 [Fusarium piperis]|uniref:Uncharacterized protein n=1 Tax=Fusarium piperis TaxID=1435070 RepID=A0A9W9BJS7_9HYPO|nr:hypothetical protein N0V84_008510 [Fusarium piperis]
MHMEVTTPQAYDAPGYNGDDMNAEFVGDGENGWDDVTSGYRGMPVYGEWQGGHQPDSQQGQDVYQYGDQQGGNFQQNDASQNADQQSDQQYDEYDDPYNDYQNGFQQNGQQDGVGWGDYQNDGYQRDAWQPDPLSDVLATMGSRSSAGRTHSPVSTGTSDNEDAIMFGNPVGVYVEEQPTVGMGVRNDQDIAIQEIGQFTSNFPGYGSGGAHCQGEPYPRKVSLSDGSEPSVDQSEGA